MSRLPPLGYRLLLLLLPPAFRREYGDELGQVLRQRLDDAGGWMSRAWVWAVTVFDVLTSALPEWKRALKDDPMIGGARSNGMDEVIQNLKYTLRSLSK